MPGSLEQMMIQILEQVAEGHRVIPELRAYFGKRRAEQALHRREQNRIAQAAHRRRNSGASAGGTIMLELKKERSPRTPLKKKNISTPVQTISPTEDEEVLTQLTEVLSRESAMTYLYHHRRIGKPIVLETVAAHCRSLREHPSPDRAADRMVCAVWNSLPPPELLDAWAREPSLGAQAGDGHAPKGGDRAYPNVSREAPRAACGRKRGRKPREMQAKTKQGKWARGKDLELTQRLAIRDTNRKESLLPKELVDSVPDIPLGKYRPVKLRWLDPNAEDDLYNRSYRRHDECVRSRRHGVLVCSSRNL